MDSSFLFSHHHPPFSFFSLSLSGCWNSLSISLLVPTPSRPLSLPLLSFFLSFFLSFCLSLFSLTSSFLVLCSPSPSSSLPPFCCILFFSRPPPPLFSLSVTLSLFLFLSHSPPSLPFSLYTSLSQSPSLFLLFSLSLSLSLPCLSHSLPLFPNCFSFFCHSFFLCALALRHCTGVLQLNYLRCANKQTCRTPPGKHFSISHSLSVWHRKTHLQCAGD